MFSRSNTSFKAALYGLMLVVFYLLQSVPAINLKFMNITPELLLVLTVCVAFNENETFAAFFGLAAGIINDTVTDAIVGKNAIIFMFAGFLISMLCQTIFRRFFLTYIFITLCTLTLFLVSEYLLVSLFYGSVPLSTALVKVILPKFFYSGVLAYPVYFIVKFLHNKLNAGGDAF